MRRRITRLLLVIFLPVAALIYGGCFAPGAHTPPASPPGEITFVIPIDTSVFNPEKPIQVQLWNAEQLEIMENNKDCIVMHEIRTGATEIQCPEGITHQEVNPEEFSFPIQEIGSSITITSSQVRLGEGFQINIWGLNKDNCNSTRASFAGKANAQTMILDIQLWNTTEMWCATITPTEAITLTPEP